MAKSSTAEETKVVAIESLLGKTVLDLGYHILNEQTLFTLDELKRAGSDVFALARLAAEDPARQRCLDAVRTANPFNPQSSQGCFVRVVHGLEFELMYTQLTVEAAQGIVRQIRDGFARYDSAVISEKDGYPSVYAFEQRVGVSGFTKVPAILVNFFTGNKELLTAPQFYVAASVIVEVLQRAAAESRTELPHGLITDFTLEFLVQHMGGRDDASIVSCPAGIGRPLAAHPIAQLRTFARIGRGANEGIQSARVILYQ